MTEMDCYFFVDLEVPEEDRTISSMHIGCRNEKRPNEGWFYQGSVEGYGPFDYRCKVCNGLIHEAGRNDKKNETTS